MMDETKLPTLNLAELEKLAVKEALEQCGGNRTKAAKTLGTNVRTLQRKIRQYDLPPASAANCQTSQQSQGQV
jgi:DNA-binding protein Fis